MYRSVVLLITMSAVFLGACSDAISPDEHLPYSSGDYLASPASDSLLYDVLRDGAWYEHAITDSGNGNITDLLLDNSGRMLARSRWFLAPQGGTLRAANNLTLWHLPSEYRMNEQVVSAPGPVVQAQCMLPLDASNLLVGTVANGIFHYNAVRGDWYAMDFPGRGTVTALCKDSTANNMLLFAGTASDGLYSKSRFDSSWTKLAAPAGAIDDIESSRADILYAVINRRLWFSRRPYASWASFNILPGSGEVNDIAILPVTRDEEILLVATESSGIAYIQLIESMPAQIGYSERSGYEHIRSLSTCVSSPYVAVGISDPPLLFVAPEPSLWIGIPFETATTLHCVAQSSMRGTVLVGTDNGIFRFDGTAPMLSGLAGQAIRALRGNPDGTFYAGTENGFYRSRDDGRTWTRIDGGTILVRVEDPWQLLPRRFAVGSSWKAATLFGTDAVPFEVTGRVQHHFDELILPDDRGRYADAIAVRYARESESGGVRADSYVWTGYFVRGKGLVFIEESRAGTVIARTFLASSGREVPL